MRIQKLIALLITLGLFASQSHAESKGKKFWRASAAVLGAITIADMQSSAGRRELNPLLQSNNGRFGPRGIALKSLIVGGGLAGQYLFLRKNPNAAAYAAGMNFAVAGATGMVVARNHMVK